MALNTAALKWSVTRLISGPGPNIRSLASDSWEICPSDVTNIPPAIYLASSLERITALSPWRNWETEHHAIEGRPTEHAATRAYLVKDVTISGSFLFRGTARAQEGFGSFSILQTNDNPHERIKEACLTSCWSGSHYFGVFMRASLPQEMLPQPSETAISMMTKPYDHEAGYRQLLQLPLPKCVTSAHVKRLILYTDYAHNASKSARFSELRRRMRASLGPVSNNRPGAYLKRGNTGERRIVVNEKALEEVLSAKGFDIVEPAKLSPYEISQRLLDVPVIVSVEGSHLAHGIYSIAAGGTFLVLQPPNRFAMAFKEFTDRAGMQFAFTVGHPAANGFSVDIDDLERTLDLL
ncbi:hypothetical protein RA27_10310 [Ruegeria sp. ANG-R]|uniref:glycosyltransferase 61 family protein n=1 Tax=Ruegeria sp. ANG-R TaxID=1577903 RepID=UPI00057FFBB1|nr:glycosyltransferase family 61 protein [Ruegeria sp. ANG-R]KIC41617.1 hypothetical protein RA27_10310 [Ruegeria sp. ANG-R]